MLQVDGLRVTIKGFVILRGISLDVPPGGLIGLVGRNGAGLSALMAESDLKRISFSDTIYTIKRGEIIQCADA